MFIKKLYIFLKLLKFGYDEETHEIFLFLTILTAFLFTFLIVLFQCLRNDLKKMKNLNKKFSQNNVEREKQKK